MLSLSALLRFLTLPVYVAWLTILYYTVGTPYTNLNTKKSLIKTLYIGVFGYLGKGLTLSDSRYLFKDIKTLLGKHAGLFKDLPGYGEIYTKKEPNFTCESVWLTKSALSADSPIVLYDHGGGFVFQVVETAFTALANFYRSYKVEHGVDISILLVDYSLTAHGATYPTQINEANEIYDRLVSDGYRNIIILGESAGGNLVLNTLAYLESKAYNEEVVWPKAAVAISPYLNITKTENTGSVQTYLSIDCFSPSMADYFGKNYTNGDKWLDASPMVNIETNSDKVDWKNNPIIKNGDILVLLGDHEILADQILRWCEKIGLTANYPERIAIDIHGTHIALVIDEAIAPGTLSEWREQFNSKTILAFLHEKFSA